MKGLLYPIFGLAVLGGYAFLNVSGVDPFAAGTERTMGNPEIHAAAAPAGAVGVIGASGRRSSRRSSGFRRGK